MQQRPLPSNEPTTGTHAAEKKLADQLERLTKLVRLGRERALFYLLAVSTGLRRKELASITLGQIHIDAVTVPHILACLKTMYQPQ